VTLIIRALSNGHGRLHITRIMRSALAGLRPSADFSFDNFGLRPKSSSRFGHGKTSHNPSRYVKARSTLIDARFLGPFNSKAFSTESFWRIESLPACEIKVSGVFGF
jgi:hypothetical protein